MRKIVLLLYVVTLLSSCNEKSKEIIPDRVNKEAQPFQLSDLRLLDGSPFKHAMNRNGEWLLTLEPDRLLHNFRVNAGLEPKGEIYGGWEALGVSGHTLGHYLSACSMMSASTDDKRFKERVDYIIEELAECQAARKTGYIGAIPDEDKLWEDISNGKISSDGFNLNGYWVPWYTQHKIWAGLLDAYLYAGNNRAKEIVIQLSDWAVRMFSGLTDDQFQTMLISEFGGMNESLAEVYAITGNQAYLKLAERFFHKAIFDPLKNGLDELDGKHANTQIPKIIGAARLYELTAKEDYHKIATFFWDRIANHRTYLNGGNSNYEHLGPPDKLNNQLSAFTSETCNTYNMLKLTKHLFTWKVQAAYFDFYERALYNHILASQNPKDGMVCYCVPLESGQEKKYSTHFDSFWCCVGTGIENHTKYAESIFFKSADDGLFINLFIPAVLQWKEKGLEVKLETALPETTQSKITFNGKKQRFPLYIRYPKWATQGIKAKVNGIEKVVEGTPGSYFTLNEDWGSGTELTLEIPMSLYTESMPDNVNRIGVFYGPVLLSAPFGKKKIETRDIPVFISDMGIIQKIQPTQGKSLTFTAATSPKSITLIPFYKMHDQVYAVYFDIFSTREWGAKEKELKETFEQKKKLEARTIDLFRIGEMQPERDHNLKSENSGTGNIHGLKFRHAYNGWFSFDVKVDPQRPVQMACTFWGTDKGKRNFNILIDGQLFRQISLKGEHGSQLFDEVYNIPFSITHGKDKINVKFQSQPDNYAGGLFGFKILYQS